MFHLDLHTGRPLTQNDCTRGCIHTVVLLRMSTELLYSNKHIIEENVRQVGYLPELYEDARSEKILNITRCHMPKKKEKKNSNLHVTGILSHDSDIRWFYVLIVTRFLSTFNEY